MRRRESETGRNRQYFTWCWCANKTLISYMWHQATHTAFKHTHSISTSHRQICFGRITANEQERHYTVWLPRQSFTLQFTRHAIVLKNSEMSGAGRHYSVTKVQWKCSLKGALCSFLVNKLQTKIWITCIQMCRILSRSSSRLLRWVLQTVGSPRHTSLDSSIIRLPNDFQSI